MDASLHRRGTGAPTVGDMRRLSRVAVTAACTLALTPLATAQPASAAATTAPSSVTAHFVRQLSGLVDPVAVTSARDGVTRLFVTERRGEVRLVAGTSRLQSKPYLDIRSEVATGGTEQGMLSVVFDPHFSTHPYLWAAYTRRSD